MKGKVVMRDEFRRHVLEKRGLVADEAKREAIEEYTMQQVGFDVLEGIERAREAHKEQVEETGYENYPMESSMAEILKKIGMGEISVEEANELNKMIEAEEAGENYEPDMASYEYPDDEGDTVDEKDDIPTEGYPAVDVEENLPFAEPEDINFDEVDALVSKLEKENEAEVAKETEEKKAAKADAPKKNSAQIEENTKKLPANEFVAPKCKR